MNNKIPFNKIAAAIAESAGISTATAENFLKEFFALISEKLLDGENVTVKGIGTFSVTGNQESPVTFEPSSELAEAVNAPFAMFRPEELRAEVTDDMLHDIDAECLPEEALSGNATKPADEIDEADILIERASVPTAKIEVETGEDDIDEISDDEEPLTVTEPEQIEEIVPDAQETVLDNGTEMIAEETAEISDITPEELPVETSPEVELPKTETIPVKQPGIVTPPPYRPQPSTRPSSEPSPQPETQPSPEPAQADSNTKPQNTETKTPEHEEENGHGPGFGMGFLLGCIIGLAVGAFAVFMYMQTTIYKGTSTSDRHLTSDTLAVEYIGEDSDLQTAPDSLTITTRP